ncbi:uncharacterized protein LOC105189719 [Harpegnathos saltator]|uniref:Uncharacterized protein n=1 Tax=Harpegnathos saltator TaxID=610380 RepID=E2B642_HARSA|nr:uncharacterized protein LOC105189719 [Harpegnathos saltator]EFN88831.1 hypothetical protein EAI_08416 [Harpegnathos saltator]
MSTGDRTRPAYGRSREEDLAEGCKEYYLFLLELYLKEASGSRLAKLNQMFFVPTSVRFEFLDFVDEDDLQLTPVDALFQPQAGVANDVEVFNAGKSVLFAVDFDAVTDRSVQMILKIIVKKRMPDDIKPDILVGTGELDLSAQYAALRLETLQCWRRGIATSKTFDGQVPLIHSTDLTGRLDIFVRMSGFGQTIVTDFNAPQDSESFVFGAEEVDETLAYKFRKVDPRAEDLFRDSSKNLQNTVTCPVCLPETYPCVPCGRMGAIEERNKRVRDVRVDAAVEKKSEYTTSKNLLQSGQNSSQPCGKPVVLKVSGLFDNGDGEKPTVTVADESAAAKPGESDDPDHDVFILRIGKKGLVGIGEKSDIQLEMKTPKGPERRPPIRYETREMQTDVKEEVEVKERKKKPKKKSKK